MSSLIRTPLNASVKISLSKSSVFGTHQQVRNHVKIWPIHYNKNRREVYLDPTRTPYTDKTNLAEFQGVGKDRIKMRKPWMRVITKEKEAEFNKYHWDEQYKSDPEKARQTAKEKLERFRASLLARGQARDSKPYHPPQDVNDRIQTIYSSLLAEAGKSTSKQPIEPKSVILSQGTDLKFSLITRCGQEFDHELPNSSLTYITTLADLIEFYNTPIRGCSSYDALIRKSDELPKNLHILAEPLRYDIENDTFFGGNTALPGMVSKINGLRGSKKFPTLNQSEFQWPDV